MEMGHWFSMQDITKCKKICFFIRLAHSSWSMRWTHQFLVSPLTKLNSVCSKKYVFVYFICFFLITGCQFLAVDITCLTQTALTFDNIVSLSPVGAFSDMLASFQAAQCYCSQTGFGATSHMSLLRRPHAVHSSITWSYVIFSVWKQWPVSSSALRNRKHI